MEVERAEDEFVALVEETMILMKAVVEDVIFLQLTGSLSR